ncbi:hypothetical protein M3J09_009544 [Ascochyta lentis]
MTPNLCCRATNSYQHHAQLHCSSCLDLGSTLTRGMVRSYQRHAPCKDLSLPDPLSRFFADGSTWDHQGYDMHRSQNLHKGRWFVTQRLLFTYNGSKSRHAFELLWRLLTQSLHYASEVS